MYYEVITSSYEHLKDTLNFFEGRNNEVKEILFDLENKKIKYFFNYREKKRLKNIEKYTKEFNENESIIEDLKPKVKDFAMILDDPFSYDLKHIYYVCVKNNWDI